MTSWKCSNCGYTFEADAHPNECPSCKEKCEFVDNTCYTPDCAYEGKDDRIGKPKSWAIPPGRRSNPLLTSRRQKDCFRGAAPEI